MGVQGRCEGGVKRIQPSNEKSSTRADLSAEPARRCERLSEVLRREPMKLRGRRVLGVKSEN